MSDIYDIILYPNSVLKQVASPIGAVDDTIKKQAKKMVDTMYSSRGCGLAANQVNITNRMFAIDYNPDSWEYANPNAKTPEIISTGRQAAQNPIVMINPEIVKKSDRLSHCMEGCLSLPQQFAMMERPTEITVEYVDATGHQQFLNASGLDAHIIQHELDHLDGTLFIDYLSRLKRGTLIRKLEKYKKYEGLL